MRVILEWLVPACGHDQWPGVAPGSRVGSLSLVRALGAVACGWVPVAASRARAVLAGGQLAGGWQGADRGQDGGQQDGAGGQAHDQLPAVAHQPGGGEDQCPPQGGDHRLAAAGPVPL